MKPIMLILLLSSSVGLACPKAPPAGFEKTPGQTEQVYNDKAKTISIAVRCDNRVKPDTALKALQILGEVHGVSSSVSFVDIEKGSTRIYVSTEPSLTQISVVAKTSEAMERYSKLILDYIKN